MSNFPNKIDTDIELPPVNDNITEVGSDAINSLRDAVFNIENEIGLGGSGSSGSIAARLGVSLNSNGTLKASALTSAGLVSLPIYDYHIASAAEIAESKLNLDHATQDLWNKIQDVEGKTYTSLSFIADTGSKLQPHLDGYVFRHKLNHIDVEGSFKNKKNLSRDNLNLFNLFQDFNNDYVSHQKSDGTNFGLTPAYLPGVGTLPPDNYAHNAAGIFVNTNNFSYIPQTAVSIQDIVEFIDNSNIFLLGTRVQTFYSNGISKSSRSSSVLNPSFGTEVIPVTKVKTYLLNNSATSPVDNIDTGDDVIEFFPTASIVSSGLFDTQFSQVKVGDVINITYSDGYGHGPDGYGSPFTIQTIINSKKALSTSPDKRYVLRINNKNLFSGNFTASVYKTKFNTNKYGVLAAAQANSPTGSLPSLIIGSPRAAQTLGIGFEADQIDEKHYNLYISFYPNGNPLAQAIQLPAIDISGNKGKTPGAYTLNSVVEATNNSFRSAGYNFRFMAFSNKGEFGIMMTDSYGNAGFSIIAGTLSSDGNYDYNTSLALFPSNVVGVPGNDFNDALGFSLLASGSASPNYSFGSSGSVPSAVAQVPTKIFTPLTRNNYYVNGVERERFAVEPFQLIDGYGDSYWDATIINKIIIPNTRIETTYQIKQDLSSSSLRVGKTLVALSSNLIDSGRFFIKDIQFNICDCDGYGGLTNITVYDSVHATGISPSLNADIGSNVKIYFNSDSVSFSSENITDLSATTAQFKRFFEIYVDENGKSFSQERARISQSGNTTINGVTLYGDTDLAQFEIVSVSPKLKGYYYGSVNKINMQVFNYDQVSGQYNVYLCAYDGITITNDSAGATGKRGLVTRVYDQSNIDYIDIILRNSSNISNFAGAKNIDIQLFPSLQLDEEIFPVASVQLNENTKKISSLRDLRQYGNVSEKQLTNSALDYIGASNKYLNENGIIQGFTLQSYNGTDPYFQITGGTALVNGKFVQLNSEYVNIPILRETLVPYGGAQLTSDIEWILCINDKAEYEYVAFSDFNSTHADYANYTALSLNYSRMMYVTNINNSSSVPYNVKSSGFRTLIFSDLYKDLTPIAFVAPTLVADGVTGKFSVSSCQINTIPRYIGGGASGINDPFILGSSFKDINVLTFWIERLNNYTYSDVNTSNRYSGCVVKVKDNFALTSLPNTKVPITYIGDGGSFTCSGVSVRSNISFKNITFKINTANGLFITGSDISFENCVFNYNFTPTSNYNSALLSNYISAAIRCSMGTSSFKNIKIDNNIFNVNGINHFPAISFYGSSTSYVENLSISKNSFRNNVSVDDKRALISFISTSTANPSSIGTRLVNVNINDNVFDKNQMIIISALQNGSDVLTDMLIPVNFNIKNNICGSICFMVRQDIGFSSFNNGQILDKNNYLTIENNNCKYIYSGFSSGFGNSAPTVATYNVSAILSGQGLYSASVKIADNLCSWIHVGIKSPSGYSNNYHPELIIDNNRLLAYPSTFLNEYYNNIAVNNTALIVNEQIGN